LTAFGTLNLWRGFQIGCYTCHNGPTNDNRNSNGAPVVSGGTVPTTTGTPVTTAIAASDPNNNPLTLWVVSQPANATVGLNGATATINPLSGFEGSDSFTVAAWDGQTSSNLATVNLKVTATKRPQVATVVNAASFQPGPVAPGEVITIGGTGLGPTTPAGMLVNSAGLVNRSLAGTQVLFDGVAAPVFYTSDSQINAIAPWGLAGKTSTSVQVGYGGVLSYPVSVGVAPASPAIFSGAVLNQDGSLNSAAGPAPKGSYLIIYATGGGEMTAPAFDGAFSSPPLANTVATASAQIGGVAAPVTYAGDAPYLISGALQINVQVPTNAPSGVSVPLILQIGDAKASAYNIAVK
jgi:uncharacterized protein (TIGR03437 family)